jgi:DNA polymerase-3 subunit gamma/tau
MKYAPAQGKYKVFIIDECQMLSKSAMNAFLKALEEPPKHVIFILCTTDPQSLPVTIISRCQRFDFKRISVKKIIERLTYICEQEYVNLSPEILELIAKVSDGAMRDALSILEKVISIEESQRTEENIAKMLSMSGNETISKLVNNMLRGDIFNALLILNELDNDGQDFTLFIKDMIKYVRNLMILSANGPEEIIPATKEDIAVMKQIVDDTKSSEKIIELLELLQTAENNTKWNSNPKVALETVAVKLNQNKNNKEIEELKNMITTLQQSINNISAVSSNTEQQEKQQPKQNNANSNKPPQQNPVVVAKAKIAEISRRYNKGDFADALERSKIFMQENIMLFQSKDENDRAILENNKKNLKNGFTKYLQRDINVEVK